MNTIKENNSTLIFKLTPWDTKSLKLNTIEITTFELFSELDFDPIYNSFLKHCSLYNTQFVYLRIDFENKILRRLLMNKGFYVGEMSYHIIKRKLNIYSQHLPIVNLKNVREDKNIEEIINQIANFTRDSFNYGRFHDDVFIPNLNASNRYYNWIYDLVTQDNEFYYIESKNEIIGFHVQKLVGSNTLEMILTGAKKGKSEVAIPLWHSVLKNAKERGIDTVETIISSSNIGVINLYSYFGFRFNKSLVGLHKKI
jgi:hypothetical protein